MALAFHMVFPTRSVTARTLFLGIVFIVTSLFSQSGQTQQPLPELGSGEGSLVSLSHDKSIAEQVLRNLRHDDLILDDPLLAEYIQNLGNRIAGQANWKRGSFHFFILKDMEINAFALPAGYIAVNAGLFLHSQSEDELAAVLAHEISHVTQRHYNRASEFIKQQDVFLAAAIIAAIASGGNDNGASMALLMGSMANNLHANLAYSRSNEQEADRLGIELLYRASFDGQGMVRFFDKLHQSQRFNNGELSKYLRSHPVTLERLSDARHRLKKTSTQKQHHASDYLLMWHRLAYLAEIPSGTYQEPEQTHLSKLYKQALMLEQSKQYEKILLLLEPELRGESNSIPLSIYIADIYQKAGKRQRSLALYQQLHELYPTQISIIIGYCKQLLDTKQTSRARTLLRRVMNRQQTVIPELYKLLAQIEIQQGARASAYRYLSIYYFETGRPHQALQQLELGLATTELSFYEREELEAQQYMVQQHIRLQEHLPTQ